MRLSIYCAGAIISFVVAVVLAIYLVVHKKKQASAGKWDWTDVLSLVLLPILVGLCITLTAKAIEIIADDSQQTAVTPSSVETESPTPAVPTPVTPTPATPTPSASMPATLPPATPMLATPTPATPTPATPTPAMPTPATPTPATPTPATPTPATPTPATPSPTPTDNQSFQVLVEYERNPLQTSSEGIDVLVIARTSTSSKSVTITASSGDKEYGPYNMHKLFDDQNWSFNANFYETGSYTIMIEALSLNGEYATDTFTYDY